MPPLLVPSPLILDQTFPRLPEDLGIASRAIARLSILAENGDVILLFTPALIAVIKAFDWSDGSSGRIRAELFGLLMKMISRSEDRGLIRVSVKGAQSSWMHPLPESCDGTGQANVWASDVAAIFEGHMCCTHNAEWFVGVACERGFSGLGLGQYVANGHNSFPLVGEQNLGSLSDSFDWNWHTDYENKTVQIRDLLRAKDRLQIKTIDPPRRDSHYKVTLLNGSVWNFSLNDDPIPRPYLNQLAGYLGMPVGALIAKIFGDQTCCKMLKFRNCNRLEI